METEFDAAKAAFKKEDYSTGLRLLESHLRRCQHDGRGWETFGFALDAVGNFVRSVSALEHATVLVPLQPIARIRLAIGYGKLGRECLSRELLDEMVSDPAMTAELLVQVAFGLDAVNSPDLAAHACRRAVACDPRLAQPHYDLGFYAAKCGCPLEFAISQARKAVSLEPLNTIYRIGLASLLMNSSRTNEAYGIVKDLSETQIRSIRCPCCLERIIPLFELYVDEPRVTVCRHQLAVLAIIDSASSDCEEA